MSAIGWDSMLLPVESFTFAVAVPPASLTREIAASTTGALITNTASAMAMAARNVWRFSRADTSVGFICFTCPPR
jgi:hypothetical protein